MAKKVKAETNPKKPMKTVAKAPPTQNKPKKVSTVEIWRRHILDSLKKDLSMYPPLRSYNYYSSGMATMSGKDLITFYYTIDGYPPQLPIDFKEGIRQVCLNGIRVSFISTFEPTRIDWDSPQMKSKIRTWRTIDREAGVVDEYNYRENINLSDSVERRKLSLIYLSDAEVRRQRNLFKYRTMMIVAGARGNKFDKTIDKISAYCKNTGIKITRVDKRLFDFLRAFSPFSVELSGSVLKECGNTTIPDEQLARFSTYDQGKIGDSGINFGTDIYSGFPVYKVVKRRSTDTENILITAETGGGKSYFIKYLLFQLLAQPNIRATIQDIEGFEYIPFAGFFANMENVVILNMAEGSGAYYDPFEIVLTGNKKIDKDMFSLCKSTTMSIFRVLIGVDLYENNDWGKNIVGNAVTKAYTDLGVSSYKMSTWVKSRGHDLFYVYGKLKDLYQECLDLKRSYSIEDLELNQRYKMNDSYLDTMDRIIAKLSEYFEPFENGGIHADVFSEKIELKKIIDAKIVLCSFGLAGKSPDSIDSTQLALAQMSAANISHVRSMFAKSSGRYEVKLWEEFQRWGTIKGSESIIKTAITGGRKLGDINFIITNNVKDLLDNDRFAIFDNISSFLVGAIDNSETREKIVTRLSVPLLKPDLDSLVTKKGNTESFKSTEGTVSMYDKAFLVRLDKSVATIAKVQLPKHIADSAIFRTGIDLDGN